MSENAKPTLDLETKHYSREQAENLDRSAGTGHIPKFAVCTLTNKGGISLTNNLLASLIKCDMVGKPFIHIFCTDDYSYNYYRGKGYTGTIKVEHVKCEEEHSITRNKLPSIKNLLEKDINVIYIDNDIYVNQSFLVDVLNIWYGNCEDESVHSLMFQDDRPRTPYCTGLICMTPKEENIELLNKAIEINNRYDDQMSVIRVLAENSHITKNTVCTFLPGEYFPNGYRLKRKDYDKEHFRVAHANYVVGMDEKIELLKSCDCWIDNAEEIISK